jgi:exodeoxyribonuclease VII small subunit
MMTARPKAKPETYHELSTQLTEVLSTLQQEDLDIDAALSHYSRGLELVEQLRRYLETTENKITQLQAKHASDI